MCFVESDNGIRLCVMSEHTKVKWNKSCTLSEHTKVKMEGQMLCRNTPKSKWKVRCFVETHKSQNGIRSCAMSEHPKVKMG